MPTWNDIRLELDRTRLQNGNPDFDRVRRAKITELSTHTGRPLLIYASDFLNQGKMPLAGQEINLDLRDKDGFLECTQRIPGETLDVLIHSPGGLAEAAESIVKILRRRFRHIRFIVPNIAKSAATMLVLSGDQIVMDTQSELGPTDPQFFIPRGDGSVIFAPAQAIIDQFEKAEATLKADPKRLPAWIPILPTYGPALYQQCKNAITLSKRLVKHWLSSYMFGQLPRRRAIGAATKISNFFANHNNFLTHLRRVDIDEVIRLGAVVHDMRGDPDLQSRVHALYFAIVHTFDGTGAFKIIENSEGDAYVRNIALPALPPAMMLQLRPGQPAAAPPQQPPPQGVLP